MRQAEAGALDIVEEGEAGSQSVDVAPEQLCSLKLAARPSERVGEVVNGDQPLGGFTCDVGLDARRPAGAVPALEVDELVDEGASRFGDGPLDGEPDGGSVGVGMAGSRVLQMRCMRAPQSAWDML